MLEQIGRNAKAASRVLAIASGEQKNEALAAVAQALRDRAADICAENERDLAAGRESGLSEALLDRLMLNDGRIAAIADAMEHVAALPDLVPTVGGSGEPCAGQERERLAQHARQGDGVRGERLLRRLAGLDDRRVRVPNGRGLTRSSRGRRWCPAGRCTRPCR